MKGIPTHCSICGVEGEVYGCPSWYDVCVDTESCRDRAIANKDREIANKDREIERLNKELMQATQDQDKV